MKPRNRVWTGVKGENVVRLSTDRPADYAPGRRCRVCFGPLSRYNAGPNCYVHTEATPIMLRAGRRKVGAA